MLKKTDYNATITEIENKIPSMNSLATNAAWTAVDVSCLVKETDYDTKISEIEKKITDHNYDKYNAAEIFAARLA